MSRLIETVLADHFDALKRYAQDCCANPNPELPR